MRIVESSYEILSPLGGAGPGATENAFINEAKLIERAGRTAYKSEDRITADSYDKFIRAIITRKHEAVIEFGSMAAKFITDRGVTHELVRHRLCSFVQESTRYVNYNQEKHGKEITVVCPSGMDRQSNEFTDWHNAMLHAEGTYMDLINRGIAPQTARSVLPNSVKTEIVVRANFREWRHIFRIRAIEKASHPDMRALMIPLYQECRTLLPCVFDMGEPE